jgi:hypothetical protein
MLRFTIRDLLWLTVVAAVGLSFGIGWWHQYLVTKATQRDLRAAQQAREAFELDARDLGNMFDTFGDSMSQKRMEELRKKYIERRWP